MTDTCLHHAVERHAREHPGAVAVVDGARRCTYAELDALANQLAHELTARGVRRGDRVGLYLAKSLEAVVAVHGIMKAGAAYVPFDPAAPVGRLAGIATDAGITVVVSAADRASSWPELAAAVPGLVTVVTLTAPGAPVALPAVEVVGPDQVAARPRGPVGAGVISRDLAYVLYTSGSTGVPKGVMLTHDNGMAFVRWAADEFGLRADDRVSSHAPLHFDLSTFDLYATAIAGATCVLVPPAASVFPVEVARFIADQGITVWYSVPSILTMLALRGGLADGDLPSLRTVLFAGEVFPTPFLRELVQRLPHAAFANLFGPTETNVCTFHRVTAADLADDDPIPIGRPIDDVEVLAVTDDGAIAGPGEAGELWVRGRTVMAGYWGLPDRTTRSLVPAPAAAAPDLAYRTGDLCRRDDDGVWHYLGRRDDQIKSRGYRIELGDVEAALYAHPAVLECAVLAVPDPHVTNRLHAVVVADGDADADARTLTGFLRERLPAYMVPSSFEVRSELPRTSTGKIDRQQLQSHRQEVGA